MNTEPLWLNATQSGDEAVYHNIAYIGTDFKSLLSKELPSCYKFTFSADYGNAFNSLYLLTVLESPDLIIVEADEQGKFFNLIEEVRKSTHLHDSIIIVLSKWDNRLWRSKFSQLKVHDYYLYPFSVDHLHNRIKLLLKLRLYRPQVSEVSQFKITKGLRYQMPLSKRLFDIFASAFIIALLSPLLLLVYALIRLDSSGPAIYRSSRVGSGYKIFNFYKFRSMQADADKKVGDFENFNQYLSDGDDSRKAVFFKVLNDPRVTPFGRFLRGTSIDELPQLFNILIGDMSFVGNRPLPLYEAEQLTSNEWSKRFLGPAGLTGLWQIKQRGKAVVSEQERKELDNNYVTNHSFMLDMKILFQTIPAVFQKAKV